MKVRIVGTVASLVGVGISIYLTALHYAGIVPACPASTGFNCEAVLTSAYSTIAGSSLPTSAAGILWFAVSSVIWLFAAPRLRLAWSVVGLATVLFLVFVEIVLLGTVCVWCSAAHLLVVLLFVIAASTMSASESPTSAERS